MATDFDGTCIMKDAMQLLVERLSRQIYWSFPALRRKWRRKEKNAIHAPQQCLRVELLRYLDEIGVRNGSLAMVHTGVGGMDILDVSGRHTTSAVALAQVLLDDLIGLVGSDGTLVMPTHAMYQTKDMEIEKSDVTTYDPRRSPCGVGLVNELFWRRKGVERSLFPFNMLAAYGPIAGELLRDNLNVRKPSPHGPDSGYYRICQRNGLVVSVGVPLRECMTIAHVVEEVRADWPIKDFFVECRYRVVQDGSADVWSVKLRREDYAKFCYCRKKVGRDLVAEGVVHEGSVGSVRVDWARAADVYDFFWRKTAGSPYPYYGLWMVRKPWKNKKYS